MTGAFLLLLAIATSTAVADEVRDAPAVLDVSAALEEIRARHDLPGLVALAHRDGQPAARGACGVRSVASGTPVTLDDPFHLGSCGKAMTATLAAVLVEEGALDWDTTIAEALPELADAIHEGYRSVTLDMLLRHQGGIAERKNPLLGALLGSQVDQEGEPPALRRAFLAQALAAAPTTTPGTSTDYSNYGYATAAAMMEQATGQPWEALIVTRVFQPLGMTSAGVGSPAGPEAPVGHRKVDGAWQALPPGPDGVLPWIISPAGLEHATLGDWARFVQAHLAGARGEDGLVSAASYRRLHAVPADREDGAGYACGWNVAPRTWAKGRTLSHNGSDGTWYATVWAAPEVDVILLAATNAGNGAAATDAACVALLKALELLP